MFGSLSMWEIMFILVIALIIFGPRKLPQLGRSLGESLAQFRRASEDFKRSWEQEVTLEEKRMTSRPAAPAAVAGTPPATEPVSVTEPDPHAPEVTEPDAGTAAVTEPATGVEPDREEKSSTSA